MRNLVLLIACAVLIAACNNEKTSGATTTTDSSGKTAVSLPYTASYSSSFEIGNPEHSATILQGSWKDWENNNLDNMKSWIADSIVAFHSDNAMVMGADSMIANWKKGRARYASVIDTIDAVIPVYSKDKKENWVLVWATEINTRIDGTKDTSYMMETWRINKDGKADLLLQFDRAKRKK